MDSLADLFLGGLIAQQIDSTHSVPLACRSRHSNYWRCSFMLQLGDKVIKRLWTSGRELQIEHHAITANQQR